MHSLPGVLRKDLLAVINTSCVFADDHNMAQPSTARKPAFQGGWQLCQGPAGKARHWNAPLQCGGPSQWGPAGTGRSRIAASDLLPRWTRRMSASAFRSQTATRALSCRRVRTVQVAEPSNLAPAVVRCVESLTRHRAHGPTHWTKDVRRHVDSMCGGLSQLRLVQQRTSCTALEAPDAQTDIIWTTSPTKHDCTAT